ncbi:hypothetical protein F441_05108 [Phytophthora nicotianae CJ01A1]|uniref:Uncharacterized protein n=3 Tax=Phytophthora nicotianae TaxID=4792 RepID=V9FJG3_PHYNI|nr:hypothetical protein F443_05107 [Phytophthora nicotianae P1569]ETK91487.1 hypothetical protein L915_04971 [Phytophthora nicotianae]ETL44892.1 hypothetical protein L916_04919 [Phytophthora nicotianae]ETM51182.1 hypothetical protein L914_04923 [Phytophthora nicotianae]ETP21373.1 hypothetical protein F441_05108 [Phytophthora nicotianae CJ01A1]
MDNAANERFHSFVKKKPARKAASLHERWKQLKTSHPGAVHTLTALFLYRQPAHTPGQLPRAPNGFADGWN